MSTKDKRKYHVKKRCFLNREYDMTAFIVGIVQDTRVIPDENDNEWRWGKIELMLADCGRKVSFDFDLSDDDERLNSLYKIRRIADIVNQVKEAIEIEAKSIGKRKIPEKTENAG